VILAFDREHFSAAALDLRDFDRDSFAAAFGVPDLGHVWKGVKYEDGIQH
jgi:hypothetical protein